jgi:ligand-binding SRPBCC domain-containing protein
MHTFHAEQWLPLPIEEVFVFFADPANLPRLMPAWQQARIEAARIVPPAASEVARANVAGAGTLLTLSFRPFPLSPVRMQWQARIDSFVWNRYFSDTQLRGPFAHWHHTHSVISEARADQAGASVAGTLLRDDVEYELPLGPLSSVALPLIAAQMRKTFAYRHRRTRELLLHR